MRLRAFILALLAAALPASAATAARPNILFIVADDLGEEKTIADRLCAAGYAMALAEKWRLGGTAPFHSQRRARRADRAAVAVSA